MAVGYSDHTLGIEVAIAAVALGATVIEKHFTLDRTLPGPDHKASLEPEELKAMVAAIRNVEQALGDGIKRPSPSETQEHLDRPQIAGGGAGDSRGRDRSARESDSQAARHRAVADALGRSHRPPAPRDFAADELIEL